MRPPLKLFFFIQLLQMIELEFCYLFEFRRRFRVELDLWFVFGLAPWFLFVFGFDP